MVCGLKIFVVIVMKWSILTNAFTWVAHQFAALTFAPKDTQKYVSNDVMQKLSRHERSIRTQTGQLLLQRNPDSQQRKDTRPTKREV